MQLISTNATTTAAAPHVRAKVNHVQVTRGHQGFEVGEDMNPAGGKVSAKYLLEKVGRKMGWSDMGLGGVRWSGVF